MLNTIKRFYRSAEGKPISSNALTDTTLKNKDTRKVEPIGKVSFLLGNITIKGYNKHKWAKLLYGQKLVPGDSLRLGINSKIEITFKNGKVKTLNGFQKLRVDNSMQFHSDEPQVSGGKETKISKLKGTRKTGRKTSPASAIRSDKPQEKKEEKPKLKIRITE